MKYTKFLPFLALAACAGLFSGCQVIDDTMADLGLDEPVFDSSRSIPPSEQLIEGGNCPAVKVADELSALSEFSSGEFSNTPADQDLVSRVRVADLKSTCSYGPKSVTVDLAVTLEGTLGPAGRPVSGGKSYYSYPFFIAVSQPGGKILAKEVFAAPMTYPAGQMRQTYTEKLRQIIPVRNQGRGARYQVLVGFQLTDEQLAYNRRVIAQVLEAKRLEEEARRAQNPLLPSFMRGDTAVPPVQAAPLTQQNQQPQQQQQQSAQPAPASGGPVPVRPLIPFQ